MSIIASQLVAQVSIVGVEQAIGKLLAMNTATDDAGKKFALLAGGGVAIAGAALIGIGAASVKMAGDFQQGMTSLVTGAGESAGNLKLVSSGILDLAVQTGTSTKQLTDGMFMIESAGYHGSQGLNVLKVAAEGARVGNADLGVVANAMTTYMQDYHVSATHAAEGMNWLTAVVSNGKTHLQDLAGSMSAILPIASAYGISASDVGGAIAVMTNAGMSAQNATQNLANAVRALETPNKMAIKSLKDVGLSAQDLHAALTKGGLPAALQEITDAVGKRFSAGSVEYDTAMKKIMGGATGLNVAMMLGGKNMDAFHTAVKNVGDALKNGGDTVTGWDKVQQDFNFKMAQAREVVETLGIKIGTALLPVMSKILGVVTPLITRFADWLTKSGALEKGVNALVTGFTKIVSTGASIVAFFQHNQVALVALQGILIAVAGAIVASMVVAFYSWAVAAGAAAIATLAATWPILAIGAVIALVVVGIILAVQHWGQISAWLRGVWEAVLAWFRSAWGALGAWFQGLLASIGGFFSNIWSGIVSNTQRFVKFLGSVIQTGMKAVFDFFFQPIELIVQAFVWLYNHNYYFKDLVDSVRNIVQAGMDLVQHIFHAVIDWIVERFLYFKAMAEIYWQLIYFTIYAKVLQIESWLHGIWQSISTWWNGVMTTMSNDVSDAWGKISSLFSSAWTTYIGGPLGNLWNQISGWFGNLASQAFTWGKNAIQGLIDGINNMAGQAGQAASNVMSNIAKFLGFHSPAKEGEGAHIIEFGQNMVKGFLSGVDQTAPLVTASISHLISPVSLLGGVPTGTTVLPQSSTSPINHITVQAPDMYLDGHVLSRGLMPHIVDHIQYATGKRG